MNKVKKLINYKIIFLLIINLNENKLGIINKSKKIENLLKTDDIEKNSEIVKRNNKGQYLTCDDKIIDVSNYKGKWTIPKCLVKSNYNYKD